MKRRPWELVSLPETNSSPLKRDQNPRGKDHLRNHQFSGAMLNFGDVSVGLRSPC